MKKQLLKDGLGWGSLLWLIGYILGIILFMLVPQTMVGWIIMPIGVIIAIWILIKKIKNEKLSYYFLISIIWTLVALILDYIFIVKLFKSTSYYKLDVYIYYTLTFLLPLIVAIKKKSFK